MVFNFKQGVKHTIRMNILKICDNKFNVIKLWFVKPIIAITERALQQALLLFC